MKYSAEQEEILANLAGAILDAFDSIVRAPTSLVRYNGRMDKQDLLLHGVAGVFMELRAIRLILENSVPRDLSYPAAYNAAVSSATKHMSIAGSEFTE
jgi:hypothetical protein